MKASLKALAASAALLAVGCAFAGPGDVGQVQKQPVNLTAIAMFLVFVVATLGITYWAAKRTTSASDFYTAGGGITGFQNGLAIAGDYMSAATLLGLSSLVFAKGYDGFIYTIGFFVGWPIITFLMAERLRNLGRFTFADIVSYRLDQNKVRIFAAFGSLTVVCCYLIVQMVGAGQLIKLLFGLDYPVAVVIVGALMLVYVIFGGMIATTWVQIIKAVLLLAGGTTLALMAMSQFGFSHETLASKAVEAHASGWNIMGPGSMLADPINTASMSLGLVFGIAGLPHILMRLFTVPNAKEARKSVFYATGFIGFFFLVVMVLGFAAIVIVGKDPQFFVGGDTSGALTGASAISHDLYATVLKKGHASEKDEMRVTRMATVGLGIIAICLGILFEKMNVAFLVGLTFGVAASTNFPVLIMAMYWKDLTTKGALFGGLTGLVSAMLLVVLSPAVWVTVLGHAQAIFPYDHPALFSMPLAFLVIVVVSQLDRSPRAAKERAAFDDQFVRAQTGLGAAAASNH